MVEEADARAGVAAGALRYAAARMFEDGVGDLAAAMDHLQLALDEPPTGDLPPGAARAAPARGRGGQPLDGDRPAGRRDGGRPGRSPRAPSWRSRRPTCSRTALLAREPGARGASRRRWRWCPGTPRRAAGRCEESASRGRRRALSAAVGARAPAGRGGHRAGERGRLLCRLALLAEADPERTRRGAGAVAAGARRGRGRGRGGAGARGHAAGGGARSARTRELARAVELEAEAAAGRRAGGLAGAGGGAGAPPAGRRRRARRRWSRRRAPPIPTIRRCCSLSAARSPGGRAAGREARRCLDHHAELLERSRLGARRCRVSARTSPSTTRATTRRRRRATAACWRRAPGDPVALVGAGAHRLAHRRRARAGARWPRRPSIAAATRPSARRWRCAPRSWPRRRRTICRGRRRWPGGRSRRCPATRRRCTCWSGSTRRSGAGTRWSRSSRSTRRRRRAIARRRRGAARDGAREPATRFERAGRAVRGAPAAIRARRWRSTASGPRWATRRPAALRALLRAAEKAGDALVAAEAALKLGTEIPELSAETRVRLVLPRGDHLRGARRRRRRGDPRLRGGAGAGSRLRGRRWRGWRARTTAAGSSRRWRRCCRGRRRPRPNPASASALEVEAARIYALRLGRVDDGAGGDGARAVAAIRPTSRAIAEHVRLLARLGARRRAGGGAGQPRPGAGRSGRQGGGLPAAGGDRRVAAAAAARGAGRHRARGWRRSSAERHSGAAADPDRAASASTSWSGAGRGAGARRELGASGRTGQRRARERRGGALDLAWRLADPEAALARGARRRWRLAPGDGAVLDAGGDAGDRSSGAIARRALALERLATSSGDAGDRRGAAGARRRRRASARPRRRDEALPETLRAPAPGGRDARDRGGARGARAAGDARAATGRCVILARRQLAESAPDAATRAVLLWELGCAHLGGRRSGAAPTPTSRARSRPTRRFLPALRALARLREATRRRARRRRAVRARGAPDQGAGARRRRASARRRASTPTRSATTRWPAAAWRRCWRSSPRRRPTSRCWR